tara:strand:- start:244 stop:474 length:231 start_codon:yes stop_codon:yes gene_type:complete
MGTVGWTPTAYTVQVNTHDTMPVSDAYLMDLQIEDLMYDQIDAQELEDADLPDWFLTDDDQDLEAFSLECAFGPEE